MATTKPESGQFEVGEQSSGSYGAMVAYAAHKAASEKKTQYVRQMGVTPALCRAEYHEGDRTVTITELAQYED